MKYHDFDSMPLVINVDDLADTLGIGKIKLMNWSILANSRLSASETISASLGKFSLIISEALQPL